MSKKTFTILGDVISGCSFLARSLNVFTAIRLLSVPPEVRNPTVSLLPFNMAAVILTISVSIFLRIKKYRYHIKSLCLSIKTSLDTFLKIRTSIAFVKTHPDVLMFFLNRNIPRLILSMEYATDYASIG